MATLQISDDVIRNEAREAVKDLNLVPEDQLVGVKINMLTFRKKYCLNHSPAWVKYFIFSEFPETQEVNGGWAINPFGGEPGIKGTWIKELQAAKWLESHDNEINWHARLQR